uniref:Retrotransposon protein, putative, unclassified n=1 Tax=Oryza sativa subsp. japonica TaxID=39947 RepID=Q2R3S2_ORYSJ|nr:retrotransposon protein, putative, unclassified [Oryza sativa Japonica Group]
MKVTSIQESVNMSTLTLDLLYTKLKKHEMNVLSRKGDSKSNAFVSSSSPLDVGASSSKSSFLAVFNATFDDQLEQIEEEDLALVANRITRAMNYARNRKRGGRNRCFECGSIDHLCSHCPKLGTGKREDKDDGESGDDDKGKNISSICFMARGESDIEYEDHEVLMNEISKIREVNVAHDLKNRSSLACSFALNTRTLDELFLTKKLLQKYQIAFHASLMFNMISAKKLKQSHDVLDCSTFNLNKMKLKYALGHVEYMEDVVKNNEVLSCPKCRKSKRVMVDCENCANLEKEVSYLKNFLQRFSDGKKNLNMILDQSKVSTHNCGLGFNPYAHNSRYPPVVLGVGARSGEILVKPDANKTVFKSAGIMSTVNASSSKSNIVHAKPPVVACVAKSSNATNVSNHCEKYTCSFCGKDGHIVGFYFRLAHKQKKEREIAFAKSKWQKSGFPSRKPVRPQWVPQSDWRPVRPATERWLDRAPVRPAVQKRSDRPPALVARYENMWIVDFGCSRHMTGDKNLFSSLKRASKTESIIFGDASTSAVLATGLVKLNENFQLKNVALVEDLKYNLLSVSQIVDENFEVHFKKTGSKVFDSCGDSVLNIFRYGRVFKADFENPVSPVITCLVAKFDKDVMFWHRRLGHVGFDHLTRLSGLDLVRGLPKLKKDLDLVYIPCRHAKMVSTSHAPIVSVMTDAPGTLSQVHEEDGRIFEDESDYDNDDDEVGLAGQTGHQAGQTAGTPPVRPAHEERSDRPGSSGSGTVDANLDGPPEITTSTSTDTERGSTSEVAAPLHIQRRHPPELIIGNLGERTTRSKEEVYVKQPPGFENPDFPNHVFKLSKALYALKQAPRAWYDRLKNFLLAKGFTMGRVDKMLFVLKHGDNQLFVQIYVDDIIFGCSTHALVVDFTETMRREFEMSMMGELSYFLGCKLSKHLKILLLLSTLKDYGLTFEKVPLFCDNTSVINIAKNPVQHSRTKHIDIRFHFLRDHVEKGDVEL